MLEEARKRGIVEELSNLYDEYWSNPETADARLLPYLEGDYWIGEAENIIKVRVRSLCASEGAMAAARGVLLA